MGDHNINPAALMAATLPALFRPGIQVGIQLNIGVQPKSNVILAEASRIRRLEDGRIELLPTGSSNWEMAPDGCIVHELGEPLPPEMCDAVISLATLTTDEMDKGIVGLDGKRQRPVSQIQHCPIFKVPLVAFQRAHLRNLSDELIQ